MTAAERIRLLAEELVLACNRMMLEDDEGYEPSDGYEAAEAAKDAIDELAKRDLPVLPGRDMPDYCVWCRGIYSHRDDCERGR